MDLDAVAAELYSGPRDEFTATRDAHVKDARAAGHRDLAAAIGKLRKPTSAAWVANLLARERPDEVRGLVELGDALRAAHGTLDGATLQQLSRRRHEVVHALVQQARSLARAADHPVSEAVAREVEETVTAALTDPEAAQVLAAGRLVTGLSLADYGGKDWFAGTDASPPTSRPRPPDREPGARTDRDERLDAARRDLEAARQDSAAADFERGAHLRALEMAEDRAREAADVVRRLQEQLDAAERAQEQADRASCEARRSFDDADEQARQVQRRVDDLERTLRRR